MSMQRIRATYLVPAKRGMRVEYYGAGDRPIQGVITGSNRSAYISVRFDGKKRSMPLHPTWRLKYIF